VDIEDQLGLEHLFLTQRRCRSCGKVKDLLEDFYRTRKDRTALSSYSYECKRCTILRIVASRMTNRVFDKWEYPDW